MKKLLLLALSISAVGTLTACGSSVVDMEVLDEFSGDKVSIEFWHVSPDVNGVSPYQSYADSFMEEYSNISVTLVNQNGDYGKLNDAINLSITDNSMPNIAIGYPANFIEYNQANVVAPLDNFIEHSKWGLSAEDLKDYQDTGFWDEGTLYDTYGTTYSMPLAKGSEAMYIRGDLVEKAGYQLSDLTTWEKVFEVSKKLESMGETYKFNHDDPQNFAVTLLGQSGAAFTSLENGIEFVDDSRNSGSKSIIDEIIYQNKSYMNIREDYTYGSALLKSNSVWMSVSSSTCRNYYDTEYNSDGSIKAEVTDLEIIPIPQYSTNAEEAYAVLQGPSMAMFISDNQEENLASWLFMKHLTNTENSSDYAISTGYVPVRVSSQSTEEFKAFLACSDDPSSEYYNRARACNVVISQSSMLQATPAFIGSNDARNEAGNMIANIVNRNYEVEAAFKTAKDNLFLYL